MNNQKYISIIDADSHFIKRIKEVITIPSLPENINNLVNSEFLCFGHWEISDHHDIFAVLLRSFDELTNRQIINELNTLCSQYFHGNPNLIIYPGDSTAIHLATSYANTLGDDTTTVVASPSFKAYGKHELRLEIPENSKSNLSKYKNINILFIDDSLSSGITELHAVEAFLQKYGFKISTFNPFRKSEMRWLSYTVLLRGQRTSNLELSSERPQPNIFNDHKIKYKFSSYGNIGPESLSPSTCPLCRAYQRIHHSILWANGARQAVKEVLEKLEVHLQTRSIEDISDPISFIDTRISQEVLRLNSVPIPEASIYIWQYYFSTKGPDLAAEELLGVLIFIGLNYEDMSSYISNNHICNFIMNLSKDLDIEDEWIYEAFIIGLVLFPTSIILSIIPALILNFALHQAADVIAILIAISFSSQSNSLLDTVSHSKIKIRKELLSKRQKELRETIIGQLKKLSSITHGKDLGILEIISADLNTLSFPPREESAVWVAKTLSALLHKGNHKSFLSEQIESLTQDSLDVVRNGLLQTLELMKHFPATIIEHFKAALIDLSSKISNISNGDITSCKSMANAILNDLWEDSIHKKYFFLPSRLENILRDQTCAPIDHFPNYDIDTNHIFILPSDESTLNREAFGPDVINIKSHLSNLFINSFKYYPIEKLNLKSLKESPLIICYLILDPNNERLLIITADRSPSLDKEKLFTRTHGLANMRAIMQLFGGNIEYQRIENGLFKCNYAPTDFQKQYFISRSINPDNYINMFITSFPLMLQIL